MNYYSSAEIVNILTNEGYEINQRNFIYYATERKILPDLILNDSNRKKYTDKHLYYLKAILILREKGNTLEEIKTELDQMDDEAIKLVSEMYQPFSSKSIIEEAKNFYYSNSISNSNLLRSNSIEEDSNIMNSYNGDSLSESAFNKSAFNSNNNLNQEPNNINSASVSSNITSMSNSYPQSMYKSYNNDQQYLSRNKRTIINENIILETKGIKDDCLKEIINEIENVYKKHLGDGI
jgi:DNA-binding transcriptional MerR regulator